MYSLFLKERDYPISVYLSYMMRVRGLARTEAIALLTHSAVKLGLRKDNTPPASNTVSKWGRTADVPQWAIVTAMSIIEGLGKVPFTSKEWAFWSYSACERGAKVSEYAGTWREWLVKAYQFKTEYEFRKEYRKQFKSLSYPDIAAKVVIFHKGNNLTSVNIPTIFFALESSNKFNELIDKTLSINELMTDGDMQMALECEPRNRALEAELSVSIKELVGLGYATHLSNGNIVIP